MRHKVRPETIYIATLFDVDRMSTAPSFTWFTPRCGLLPPLTQPSLLEDSYDFRWVNYFLVRIGGIKDQLGVQ